MKVDEEQPCPVSVVFNNLYLVEKVLEEVTDDIRNHMELRLVNRTFRDASHSNLRKNHRNMKIEFIKFKDQNGNEFKDRVYINHHLFKVINVDNYFLFLKNIVKVKIQSIVAKNLWQLTPIPELIWLPGKRIGAATPKRVGDPHKSIKSTLIGDDRDSLKKLIGLDEICPGSCEDCLLIPKDCVEYGPLRIEHLRMPFTTPRVLEKLIVPDHLLDDIANTCIATTTTKDECYEAVHALIPSNISCETLILIISDRDAWNHPDVVEPSTLHLHLDKIHDHRAMPREILEILTEKWNVKSIVLKFVTKTHRERHEGEWMLKGYFTNFGFENHRSRVKASNSSSFKIEDVCVDLTDSNHFSSALTLGMGDEDRFARYNDISANIRRVFRNDKLTFHFSHWSSSVKNFGKFVKSMMKNIFIENPKNLDVEIKVFSEKKQHRDYFVRLSNQGRLAALENFQLTVSSVLNHAWHYHIDMIKHPNRPFVKQEWVGSSCRMVNKKQRRSVNWTVYVHADR